MREFAVFLRKCPKTFGQDCSCTWGTLERLAQDRDGWRDLTCGVCPDGVTGDDDDGDDNDDGDDGGGNGDDDRRSTTTTTMMMVVRWWWWW